MRVRARYALPVVAVLTAGITGLTLTAPAPPTAADVAATVPAWTEADRLAAAAEYQREQDAKAAEARAAAADWQRRHEAAQATIAHVKAVRATKARQAREAAAAERRREARAEARRAAARKAAAARASRSGRSTAPRRAGGPDWDGLARCESGGRWNVNTGNGYYGGLQFNLATWRAYGGTGYPHQHSRAGQIAVAERLYADRGKAPWPGCTRKGAW